jgi:diguanylate cyclase (GGDEF)-like protein
VDLNSIWNVELIISILMKKPDTPSNEETRLKNLRSLNILDTHTEERFDRLTRLAQRMFDVPIAVVSLIDENRQWFKSCMGLDAKETSRDISFCGHAILRDEIFIIPDATKDIRFSDNPLVLDEPKIRFYAGCPLKYMDGSLLGTLCIIDTKPRKFVEDDLTALKDLAELAEHELLAVQLATLDDLTQISNRRGFLKLAQNSLDICARQKIPASLVFLDLNGFKSINDTFGHTEGDNALIAFADRMSQTFRESDIFARYGGDEFVVLLTDASNEFTDEILNRFRKSVELFNIENNLDYEIAYSSGVVSTDNEEEYSIESLLNKADTLMYKQKKDQ